MRRLIIDSSLQLLLGSFVPGIFLLCTDGCLKKYLLRGDKIVYVGGRERQDG